MVLSKISTFSFGFGIESEAESFQVFGLSLGRIVKKQLWSFTRFASNATIFLNYLSEVEHDNGQKIECKFKYAFASLCNSQTKSNILKRKLVRLPPSILSV